MSEEIAAAFFNLLEQIEHAVRMAKRHKKSLVGAHAYGKSFRAQAAEVIKQFSVLRASIEALDYPPLSTKLVQVQSLVDVITTLDNARDEKLAAIEQLRFLWKSEVEALLEQLDRPPRPFVDTIIPLEIVKGQPKYIFEVARQVNGCYNDGYYDACMVMVRRLIETLIIECYERKGIADKIKTASGDYLAFRDLIGKVINEPVISLGKTTRKGLPKLIDPCHTGAHGRRVLTRKSDIEKQERTIRKAVEEFISNLT